MEKNWHMKKRNSELQNAHSHPQVVSLNFSYKSDMLTLRYSHITAVFVNNDVQRRRQDIDQKFASVKSSGINPNIFWAAIEAPKAPRGVGPLGEGSGEGARPPPQKFLFDFGSQNGDLWCILGAIFCSSAKTLRGRKDTLAQVYFYWDRRHWSKGYNASRLLAEFPDKGWTKRSINRLFQ